MNLLDLPIDILFLIFPYLDVASFLSLTSSCKPLHDTQIADDAAFWTTSTRSTFRVPNQPVVEYNGRQQGTQEYDGRRWKTLYKRLKTQSRVYTWGSNSKANLGHSYSTMEQLHNLAPATRRREALLARHISWPTEMERYKDIGIVADLQAGGWSTSMLTSKGAVFTVGVMDGLRVIRRRPPSHQSIKSQPTPLIYPPGFPHPSDRYDPATAIAQFSAGRAHVLGISDSGRIWSWDSIDQPAYNVKFLDVDLPEGQQSKVKKVVAGWNTSAALIAGIGILLWAPLHRQPQETIEDTALVLESAVVPQTNFRRKRFSTRIANVQEEHQEHPIGEVLNFILLEHYVLFNTTSGQVFAWKSNWADHAEQIERVFPIPLQPGPHEAMLGDTVEDDQDSRSSATLATDVQGAFRSFAIFTQDGQVLTGTQAYLEQLHSPSGSVTPQLERVPALQKSGVISVAFGDYHFHALHASGTITSYGYEPNGCGSLGLGGHGNPEGRLRGIRYAGVGGDGRLVPHCSLTGRQVWFEQEKKDWIRFLVSGGRDPEEAQERLRMCAHVAVQGEVSEWVEQEGRAWEQTYLPFSPEPETDGDDNLPAHFALSITAAGWHSGALVLVNDSKVARVREGCVLRPPTVEKPPPSRRDSETPDTPSLTSYLYSTARWFLGFDAETTSANNSRPIPPGSSLHFTNPVRHGAALDESTPYRWAENSFPRLRLSDGREMPGNVPFDEFRNGRPEFGV